MATAWENTYTLAVGGAITLAVKVAYAGWTAWYKRRLPYENGRREEIVHSYRELLKRNPEMAVRLIEDLVADLRRNALEEEEFHRHVILRLGAIGRKPES